jgi:tetratricopeptide (TPR) repeat protein
MKYGRLITLGLLSLLALIIGCNSMQTSSAILRYQQGEYEIAESLCVEALELNPEDGEAYFYMALSQSMLEDYRKAFDNFKKASELKPEKLEAVESNIHANWSKVFNEGVTYTQEDNYEMAIEYFEQATQADPEEAKGYSNLARAYLLKADKFKKIDVGEYEFLMQEGQTNLEKALALETEAEATEETAKMLCTVLAKLYVIPNQEDAAREPYLTRYREVTRELPELYSTHETFGYILYEEAVEKKTASFYPFAGQALSKAADIRLRLYSEAEALGDIEAMDELMSVDAPKFAGLAFMTATIFPEAAANFTKALNLNPMAEDLWYFKEFCEYKSGDLEAAIISAKRLENDFSSVEDKVYQILAFCYRDLAIAADEAGDNQGFLDNRRLYEDAYRAFATYKGLADDTPQLLLSKAEQAELERRANALYEKDDVAIITAELEGRFVKGTLLNKREDDVEFIELSIDLLDEMGEIIDTAFAEFEMVEAGKEVEFSAFFVAEPEEVVGFEVTDMMIE